MVRIYPIIPEALVEAMQEKYLSERLTLSEFVARAVATAIGRPELGDWPRKPRGRQRKAKEPGPQEAAP